MDFERFKRGDLLLSRDVLPQVRHPRVLADAVAAGDLVRLRRGVHVLAETWRTADARQRHLLRVGAVAALARTPPVFAEESAAALWGMPLETFPDDVVVLDRWRGGGRSEPGVRRTARAASVVRSVIIDGHRATDLARTALDLARTRPFVHAVPPIDWALWRRNPKATDADALAVELASRPSTIGMRRAAGFATALSDSFGESEARCVIQLLGFEAPQLQAEFRDGQGLIVADFAWPAAGVVGEFDGKVKYTRSELTRGDPGEVVWREKQREDRLRRQVRTVVRILTSDVRRPVRLEALLLDAGVPRR